MSVIRTFVSHHGGDYEERVAPILRLVAPLGVRPWIDKVDLGDRVGLPLAGQIEEAIFRGPCTSMSLFLSKHSVTRKWVEREVELALQRLGDNFRVLPIFLDPPDEIDLPPTFRRLLDQKPLWLEPFKDPRFIEKYAQSVWAAGGLTGTSEEVTLYLGHRNPSWTVEVPAQYSHAPTLDLRLNLTGDRNYSPADTEWKTIEDGLKKIDEHLKCLKRINVCGFAPLGVGTLIGKIWDRGTGVQIFSDNFFNHIHQTWTTDGKDFLLADSWSPDVANESQLVKMSRPATARHNAMLMAFLPAGRDIEYMAHIERWVSERGASTLIQKVILPAHVANPEQAQQLVRECVGTVRFVKRHCQEIKLIEIISGYQLALAPLISYHLKNCGPLHFYDEVKITHEYRLAAVIS